MNHLECWGERLDPLSETKLIEHVRDVQGGPGTKQENRPQRGRCKPLAWKTVGEMFGYWASVAKGVQCAEFPLVTVTVEPGGLLV